MGQYRLIYVGKGDLVHAQRDSGAVLCSSTYFFSKVKPYGGTPYTAEQASKIVTCFKCAKILQKEVDNEQKQPENEVLAGISILFDSLSEMEETAEAIQEIAVAFYRLENEKMGLRMTNMAGHLMTLIKNVRNGVVELINDQHRMAEQGSINTTQAALSMIKIMKGLEEDRKERTK